MLGSQLNGGRVTFGMPFHGMFNGHYYLQLKWTSELLLEPTLTNKF